MSSKRLNMRCGDCAGFDRLKVYETLCNLSKKEYSRTCSRFIPNGGNLQISPEVLIGFGRFLKDSDQKELKAIIGCLEQLRELKKLNLSFGQPVYFQETVNKNSVFVEAICIGAINKKTSVSSKNNPYVQLVSTMQEDSSDLTTVFLLRDSIITKKEYKALDKSITQSKPIALKDLPVKLIKKYKKPARFEPND